MSIMVARLHIIVIDFHILYKGNNFRNNTDESVNLESLNAPTIPNLSGIIKLKSHVQHHLKMKIDNRQNINHP